MIWWRFAQTIVVSALVLAGIILVSGWALIKM